ncbi:MAG: AMP-binding protein [Candidatus Cloacimonetes bacterium]|nr:AMP-binding protein [Candidatus Cloacimonadota bacterium]
MLEKKLVTFIENGIKQNWDLPALSNYQDRVFYYKDIAAKIQWLHRVFQKMGVKQGDKISLMGKNSVNWAMIYLSSISYGAVIVPILPDFKADEIHHILNHSDSSIFFAADWVCELIDTSEIKNIDYVVNLNDLNIYYSQKKSNSGILNEVKPGSVNRNEFCLEKIENSSLASIVYTSGTTGFSKGVMLSHNNLVANLIYAKTNMPLQSGDSIVSFMPLAHAYGCAFEFIFPFTTGCHITFLNKVPSPKTIVSAFKAIKPQLILSVPLIIEKIYRKQIKPTLEKPIIKALLKIPGINKLLKKKIRSRLVEVFGGNFHEIVIGGAALNREVEDFLTNINFPFTIGYGMTECAPLISYNSWKVHKPGSVGFVVNSLQIRIDSPDPLNVVGEILVKGDNVMMGYYKNQQATDEVLIDGWLHTGDLGLLDKEGNIFIKGRCKNMILGPSGQNIYPEELEAKINNLPYVLESLIVERDNRMVALIYPDIELADKNGVREKEMQEIFGKMRKEFNKSLPDHCKIAKFEIYPEEFEKTPTKKIKRFLYNI